MGGPQEAHGWLNKPDLFKHRLLDAGGVRPALSGTFSSAFWTSVGLGSSLAAHRTGLGSDPSPLVCGQEQS